MKTATQQVGTPQRHGAGWFVPGSALHVMLLARKPHMDIVYFQ
jgi:hypothetical protein